MKVHTVVSFELDAADREAVMDMLRSRFDARLSSSATRDAHARARVHARTKGGKA